jgi:branched-chain amino acid transport system substrate-binding protein
MGKFTPQPPRGGLLKKWLINLIVLLLITNFNIYSQTIKIGLLIQDSSYTSAVHGAELAVRKANEKGGMNGRPFRIVTRSMEGPWGTGSKQAVDLIFNEKVWALLGSHDGRNAHLVEQAATKSIVVFISAWSADPTLTQAFVPWCFNCVPNDDQQAAALFDDIYEKRKFSKIAVIYDDEYNSMQSLKAFLKIIKQKGKAAPDQFQYEKYNNDIERLLNHIDKPEKNCIIIFCLPLNSFSISNRLREFKPDMPLYGSLSALNEDHLTINQLQYLGKSLNIPSAGWSESLSSEFSREYEKAFGKPPGMVAAYSYDGMNILINAIRKTGAPDREKIQKALREIEYYGVTGIIRFDDMGKREGKAFIF